MKTFTWISFVSQVARRAAWAPLVVLALHETLARAYGHEPYVDPIMHFSGGFAAAFFFHQAWAAAAPLVGAASRLGRDISAFSLACVTALFWEFSEFASDQFFGSNVQLGLSNTMRDLLLGVTGAALFIASSRVLYSMRSVSE